MPSDKRLPRLLTIAGSDSGGGAGIQADLKTFQVLGGYGMSAITVLTAQNTLGVKSVFPASPSFIIDEIREVAEDIGIDAVKIGMLYSTDIIVAVATCLNEQRFEKVVLDPVMVAKGGSRLLEEEAIYALRALIFPLASLVTPNLPEAEVLTGQTISTEAQMEKAMDALLELCPRVVLKGGHSANEQYSSDLYATREGEKVWIRYPRIATKNTHGTGCTFSAAIASFAAQGKTWRDSVESARAFLQEMIEESKGLHIGEGCGPLHHGFAIGVSP